MHARDRRRSIPLPCHVWSSKMATGKDHSTATAASRSPHAADGFHIDVAAASLSCLAGLPSRLLGSNHPPIKFSRVHRARCSPAMGRWNFHGCFAGIPRRWVSETHRKGSLGRWDVIWVAESRHGVENRHVPVARTLFGNRRARSGTASQTVFRILGDKFLPLFRSPSRKMDVVS